MSRSLLSSRVLTIAIVGILGMPLVGFMVLIYPHRTSLELNKLKGEYVRRRIDVTRVYQKQGKSQELSKAKADFKNWQDEARERCMQIAASNSHKQAGTTALLMVSRWWPDSAEAKEAHATLLELTETLPMDALGMALNNGSVGGDGELEVWRPFVSRTIQRVKREPDHRDSAWVLCRGSCLVNPDRYAETDPCEAFVSIGELIRSQFAARKNIQNFCEMVGGMGEASEWGLSFEPHLRQILEVNQDASLEESVGEVGFGRGTEIVIECVFVGFLGTKNVGFSGDQF